MTIQLTNTSMSWKEVLDYFHIDMIRCPFCYGPPALHIGPSPHVVCTRCAANGPTFEARKEDNEEKQLSAIRAWNARISS